MRQSSLKLSKVTLFGTGRNVNWPPKEFEGSREGKRSANIHFFTLEFPLQAPENPIDESGV
jgi:hypothetical protein